MVSKRNVISTMLQSFIALGVISVLWYVVGFSLAFGDSIGGVIGNPLTFFMFNHVGTAPHPRLASNLPLVLFAAFQLKFAIITPALISGAFAERIRFWGYLLFMCLFSLLIYCPLAHWTWHPDGFLFKWGVLDFAGGTVVHISAGFAALAGALALGRRHSPPRAATPTCRPTCRSSCIGTGLLWFGWFGFNAGSALAANATAVQAFFTTHMASAAAMLTWMLIEAVRGQRPSAAGCGHWRGGGPGGHHAGGGLRELRPGAVHRGGVGGHQRRRRRPEKPHHARRHARCISLPRRGRHRGHDSDGRFCQGGRPRHHRRRPRCCCSTSARWLSSRSSPSAARTCFTSSPTCSFPFG